MGSQVILEFHRQFPEQVCGLVSICGPAGNALDGFLNSKRFRYLFPYLLQFFRTAPRLTEFLWKNILTKPESYYTAIALNLTSTLCAKEDLLPYLEHLSRIEPRLFMELARNMAVHSTEEHLGKIQVPTLVLAGDRDTFTPLKRSKRIARSVPGAQFTVIRGGTHTAPLELPDLIHLRIQKFLYEHF
jgi:pimeloyl-ACP methyl ester carboxylesterase